MDTHKIQSNGKQYIFHVVKNTTEPCPQCGVPACGKQDILWYESDQQKIAFIFDGGLFDLAQEEFLKKKPKEMNYDSLPEFLKEGNESRGWADCSDYEGYELEIDDFIRSMELLRACEMGKWITEEDIHDMQSLAIEAKTKGAKLKIVRG